LNELTAVAGISYPEAVVSRFLRQPTTPITARLAANNGSGSSVGKGMLAMFVKLVGVIEA
jgi:hypothetical protein